MIRHIVMFKLKEFATPADKQAKMLMKIIVSRFGKKAGELASPTIRYLTSDERIDLVETAATTDTFAHFQDALRRATTETQRSPQSPAPHQ